MVFLSVLLADTEPSCKSETITSLGLFSPMGLILSQVDGFVISPNYFPIGDFFLCLLFGDK